MTAKPGTRSLWGSMARARGFLYDSGVLRQTKLAIPVLSVGNLSVGGTGKTPVVRELCEFFMKQGRRVGVISRNYRANVKGPVKVDADRPNGAAYFGDEPFLLAKLLPGAQVFVGPQKWQTALFALEQAQAPDLLIVDDGFQHRALARDFDLVLIDATDERGLIPLPRGRAREDVDALTRADWIGLTKVNWADTGKLEGIRRQLPPERPCTELRFQTQWPDLSQASGIAVFAGIARPQIFFDLAKKKYFGKIQKEWAFRDHQVYGEKELAPLRRFLESRPGSVLLTTEKDAVKIQDKSLIGRLRTAQVVVEWQNAEPLFEKLRSLVR